MTNPNPQPKFVSGYRPNGKNWHVTFGAVVQGEMPAEIVQGGQVIASLERPGTAEEIMSAANRFMSEQVEDAPTN
jgi:hypothetical protein